MFDILFSFTTPPAIFHVITVLLINNGVEAGLAFYLPIYVTLGLGVALMTGLILWARPIFSVMLISFFLAMTVGFAVLYTLWVVVLKHGWWVLWAVLAWLGLMCLVRFWRHRRPRLHFRN